MTDGIERRLRAADASETLFAQIHRMAPVLWRSPQRPRLVALGVALVVVVGATAYGQIRLNAWNQPFYDALARKDVSAFLDQMGVFVILAGFLLVLNVVQTWLNQSTKVTLREGLVGDLLREWLRPMRAFRLSSLSELGSNPDQRIHEDARHLCELSTDLGIGLLQATLLLASFITVLWALSEGLVLHFGNISFSIPGYMVWCALFYAGAASLVSYRVGLPLIGLNAERYGREAELRFALVRVSEQIDGITLDGGELDVRERVGGIFATVIDISRRIVTALTRLTWVTAGYGWFTIVAPILVAAPAYFGGSMSFGELMMAVGAFNQVQSALKWFVDNFSAIADWRATLLRVAAFRSAVLDMDENGHDTHTIDYGLTDDLSFVIEDLHISAPIGCITLSEPGSILRPGERILIAGEVGAGKTILFRAIAGLWPWGSGRIVRPPAQTIMYMPGEAYIPPGSLRSAITYPASATARTDEEIRAALMLVGMERLFPKIDRTERWDRVLTDDEKQCLAFARVVLHRPRWLVLDEALDVLDVSSRERIKRLFEEELADVGIVAIGHDEPANGFYTRKMRMMTDAKGPVFRPARRESKRAGDGLDRAHPPAGAAR